MVAGISLNSVMVSAPYSVIMMGFPCFSFQARRSLVIYLWFRK